MNQVKNCAAALMLLLVATASWGAPSSKCQLSPSVDQAWEHARTVKLADFATAHRAVVNLERCSDLTDVLTRDRFFRIVEREMSLDYLAVFARWESEEGHPFSTAVREDFVDFQHDLLDYMNQIAKPSDIAYRDVILRYGNARAIAQLGKRLSR